MARRDKRRGKTGAGGDAARAAAWEGEQESERLARVTTRLARAVADAEREEERRAGRIVRAIDRATVLLPADQDGAAGPTPAEAGAPTPPRRRALLIINSKSGPQNDSLLRVQEVVARLDRHGIGAEVRVKLRKKQARREARRAARDGWPLVVAAGGDGTVEAVASGLVGTETALGIIPLGTYNNVAGALGIPTDLSEACALIGVGVTRPVDVGWVAARGSKRPRVFLEMGAAGVTAALIPAGQEAKKGAWDVAARILPLVAAMSPTPTELRLDGGAGCLRVNTLLVEVANGPRMGPALTVAPGARMDDGLLDLAVYRDMTQAALTARAVALKAGAASDDPQIERARVRRVDVRTERPLPVTADSKLVGTTPARFEVWPGALRVIAGAGAGLAHPVAGALVAAAAAEAHALVPASSEAPASPGPADHPDGLIPAAAATLAPIAGRALAVVERARPLVGPAALVAGGAVALPLLRALTRLGRR
jgi:diacylglycerol kinase (ATP)